MKDSKNPGPYSVEFGHTEKFAPFPGFKATIPESVTVGNKPATPFKDLKVTNPGPYGKTQD